MDCSFQTILFLRRGYKPLPQNYIQAVDVNAPFPLQDRVLNITEGIPYLTK